MLVFRKISKLIDVFAWFPLNWTWSVHLPSHYPVYPVVQWSRRFFFATSAVTTSLTWIPVKPIRCYSMRWDAGTAMNEPWDWRAWMKSCIYLHMLIRLSAFVSTCSPSLHDKCLKCISTKVARSGSGKHCESRRPRASWSIQNLMQQTQAGSFAMTQVAFLHLSRPPRSSFRLSNCAFFVHYGCE